MTESLLGNELGTLCGFFKIQPRNGATVSRGKRNIE